MDTSGCFEQTLPRSLRYSWIVLLLTTIETTLLRMCRGLQKNKVLTLSVSDLAGRPPDKMLKYLTRVGGIALPDHKFQKILGHLVNVRHCIAHAAGNVELAKNPTAVREAVRQLSGFSVGLDRYVEIDKGVCERLIEEASDWEQTIPTSPVLPSGSSDDGSPFRLLSPPLPPHRRPRLRARR